MMGSPRSASGGSIDYRTLNKLTAREENFIHFISFHEKMPRNRFIYFSLVDCSRRIDNLLLFIFFSSERELEAAQHGLNAIRLLERFARTLKFYINRIDMKD